MKIYKLLALLAVALLMSAAKLPVSATELPVSATELPVYFRDRNIQEIIQKEKQFVFTDDSSYYILRANGTFSSIPAHSPFWGRVITGTWKAAKDQDWAGGMVLIVEGQWTWKGAMESNEDYRRMTMTVYPPASYEAVKDWGGISKSYKCYFFVDELVKVMKPKGLK